MAHDQTCLYGPCSTYRLNRRARPRGALCVLIFLTGSTVFLSSTLPAQEALTVRVTGLTPGATLFAKEQAIRNAKQEALRETITALAPALAEPLWSPLLHAVDRFVLGYDLLRYDVRDNETAVELDVRLNDALLRSSVAELAWPWLLPPPTVQLVIAEQLPGDQIAAVPTHGDAETALKNDLSRFRFTVYGVDHIENDFPQRVLCETIEGDLEHTREFAALMPTDTLVLGKALTETEPPTSTNRLSHNRVTLRLQIFRTADAKKTDEIEARAVVQSVDPREGAEQALLDACRKVRPELITALVLAVLAPTDTEYVSLIFDNVQSRARFDALYGFLRRFPEVQKVEEVYCFPRRARLRLIYHGSVGTLLDALEHLPDDPHPPRLVRAVGREAYFSFRE